MRAVFMGTPRFAVPIMQALAEADSIELVGVFTQPDSVSKRGRKTVPSAVKAAALELGVPVHAPESMRDPEACELLESLEPDVVVVASYGQILNRRVLDVPRLGCINVHASLLPRWRGAAPIGRAILAGDEVAGISIMRMEEGLDTGDYCMQREAKIGDMNVDELTRTLSELGRDCIVEALLAIERGDAEWVRQNDLQTTYAEKFSKAEMMLAPAMTAAQNVLRVRASNHHAPARAVVCGRSMTVEDARMFDLRPEGIELEAGKVVRHCKKLLLGCDGAYCMELLRVKPDGKKEMAAADFCAGVHEMLKNGTATWEAL